MNDPTDTHTISRRFDAIAAEHDRHDAIAAEIGGRLLERLDGLRFDPGCIADLGCGTARNTLALRKRFEQARLIALDTSIGMLRRARKRRGRWRPRFELLHADLSALPLAEATVELVHANLSMQWTPDLAATLAGIRRVMRPRGLLMMTLPGPDTLIELQRAGVVIRGGVTTHAQQLGDMLVQSGFQEPVLDTDWLTTTYPRLDQLLADLDHLGIDYTLPGSPEALVPQLTDNGRIDTLAVTWEVLYATAWAPDEGQPIRGERGEEASIPVASLGVRRRRD